MNKIFVLLYVLICNAVLYLTTYFNIIYNQNNIWYLCLLLITPLLLFSILFLSLIKNRLREVTNGDMILSICLYLLSGMVLIWIPYFLPSVFDTNVASSNIVIYGSTFTYIVSMFFNKRTRYCTVGKCVEWIALLVFLIAIISAIINCFIQIIN